MPDPLAPIQLNDIPEKSKRRGVKAQRAAYLYCVEGVSVPEISRRVELSKNHLYTMCKLDGWVEWRLARLATIETKREMGDGIEVMWTEGDIQRIGLELNKTCNLAQQLQSQRDACVLKLSQTDPRTPKYTTLVANIDKLTSLIHRYTQLDAWMTEAAERRRDIARSRKGKSAEQPEASSSERVAVLLRPATRPESVESGGGEG